MQDYYKKIKYVLQWFNLFPIQPVHVGFYSYDKLDNKLLTNPIRKVTLVLRLQNQPIPKSYFNLSHYIKGIPEHSKIAYWPNH